AGVLVFELAPDTWTFALTTSVLFGILGLSIVAVVGYCGQLTLCQYMLAGIAAWISAESIMHWHVGFLAGALLWIGAAILAGLVVAIPSLRARGINLAIATLGLAAIVQNMVFGNGALTSQGIGIAIGQANFFGVSFSPITHPQRYGVLVFVVFVAAAV